MRAGGMRLSTDWLLLARTEGVVASGPWLLRLRWAAGVAVLVATALARQVLGVGVPVVPLVVVGGWILLYNAALWMWLRRVEATTGEGSLAMARLTHVELALDWLAMIALIHLTGGVESPLVIFFVLHIIVASLLFERLAAALYAAAAVLLTGGLAWAEAASVLPHRHVEGFLPGEAFADLAYLVGVLGTFTLLGLASFYLASSLVAHARRREEQLATLYLGAQTINSTLELGEVLQRLVEATASAMDVHGVAVGLVDPTGTRIEEAASVGLSEEYLAKGPVLLSHSQAHAEVVLSGEPFIIQSEEDRVHLQYPDAAAAERIRSMLLVPLRGKEHVLGVVRAYSTRVSAFGPDDARFLGAIAAQGAVAIDNALAFGALRKIEQDKSRFVRMVTHELRSPVAGADSIVRALLGGYAGPLEDRQRDFLERLARRLETLRMLINDLLDLAAGRVGMERGEVQRMALPELIRRVLEHLDPVIQEKHQVTELHVEPAGSDFEVEANAESMFRIFLNLVGNAVKYTPEGGAVVVRVESTDHQVQVAVSDTGIGIPATALPQLFTEFFRASNAKAFGPGTGLGLVIVKELVEKMGGHISVESDEGQGTTFTVILPLAGPSDQRQAMRQEALVRGPGG
ncbi:MAG: GAF domain-containing sensor histidine kinase [Thermoanaerobaculaceae bacterium]|nr:GAF domain-containing sensor histidine kinase [Thermoanaerobaculaceae bacterium]